MNASLPELLEIGITTRNRWPDLRMTLEKIRDYGWTDLAIHIIDDGSDTACDFTPSAILPRAELRRQEDRRGLVCRRNELARSIRTKYYLSLDDDSFPVRGDLDEALRFAEETPDWLCLGFPIYNNRTGRFQYVSAHPRPYQSRAFVGCGHILNREAFLKLGGYYEPLIHQGEEVEMAARGFVNGYSCWHIPSLTIEHMPSIARSFSRMDYYGRRNKILWNDWYCPRPNGVWKQVRGLVETWMLFARCGRFSLLKGAIAGFREIPKHLQRRQRMNPQEYKAWTDLP